MCGCEACFCCVHTANHPPVMVNISSVHCIVCYVGFHLYDIGFTVQCVVRRFPLKLSTGVVRADCHILRRW